MHRKNLVYNQCWEDPRLDRQALKLNSESTVLCITSAGCNILDYLLDGPKHVFAVDMNPRQNHLLELKLAGIRKLSFETFFDLFGRGRVMRVREIYATHLRPELTVEARAYWDKKIRYFSGEGWRSSFYFHGTSGTFARLINSYINYRDPKLREGLQRMLDVQCAQEQANIYAQHVRQRFWKGALNWFLNRTAVHCMLGVPKAQRTVLEQRYNGRIGNFIQERVDHVFSKMSFSDNYFWRVYLTGSYTKECCPEYLKEKNFHKLKAGLVDRVSLHSMSIESFLKSREKTSPISHFVLLDHMDWLAHRRKADLEREWQAIVDGSNTKGARIIWRSAAQEVDFVDPISVKLCSKSVYLSELLTYYGQLSSELHIQDRVNTYGSFYIADLAAV